VPQDYARVIRSLDEHKVEFVIIGGMAAVSLGVPIATRHLDICYRRSKQNIVLLAKALEPLHPKLRGAPLDLPFVFDATTIEHGSNFAFVTDAGDLDILGYVSGLGEYAEVAGDAETLEIYGVKVKVMSLETLVKAKKATGRTKDQIQLLEIEAAVRLRREQAKDL
jgi:predicted nucleotidyltransferase